MSSLRDAFLQKSSEPYTRPLKVKVVASNQPQSYCNSAGEEKRSLHCAVSDNVNVAKLIAYDERVFSKFKENNTVVLRDVIKKQEEGVMTLVVTQNTKVFLSTNMHITSEKEEEGRVLLNPPPAPQVPLMTALNSPLKSKSTVAGTVVQEDQVRTVRVKGKDVPIKEIMLADESSARCKITLWRELSSAATRPGDYIRITDVIPHEYRSVLSLSATPNSKVEKAEAPILLSTKTLVGVSLGDGTIDLLLDDDMVITANAELFQAAFPDVQDLERVTEDGPKTISMETRGSEVISIASAVNEEDANVN